MQLRGQPHNPESPHLDGVGGDPGEKPPPAAFSQGCKPPRASAAGALRSPVQEENPFQKARLSTQIKVKLFNKSSPRSRVGGFYFCIIALSRDLEAIFLFLPSTCLNSKYNLNRQASVPT